jgi:hypothetical protein
MVTTNDTCKAAAILAESVGEGGPKLTSRADITGPSRAIVLNSNSGRIDATVAGKIATSTSRSTWSGAITLANSVGDAALTFERGSIPTGSPTNTLVSADGISISANGDGSSARLATSAGTTVDTMPTPALV